MKTEIGGEFHLTPSYLFLKTLDQYYRFVPHNGCFFFTSSGRDSLKLIIKLIKLTKSDEVLLPSYLCKDVLRPFKAGGIPVKFYKVDQSLTVDLEDIERKIAKNTKVLLVIHYFGFPQPIEELRRLCDERSLCLIEDVAQAFLTSYHGQPLGWFGNISFSSFRKFLPIPDGSLLLINKNSVSVDINTTSNWVEESLEHYLYVYLRFFSMILKYSYLMTGLFPKPFFLGLFHYADEILDEYPTTAKMSSLSEKLLKKFDFEQIISRRRENFQYLLKHWNFLSTEPFHKRLPNDVCPLGFPVLSMGKRDYVREKLIERRIYPPVHWILPKEISEDEFKTSWEISRNILTIPIDQRYGRTEMDYILDRMESIEDSNSKG